MKKVRKTTRPFGYDLDQIPYNHTMEVTNKSKELNLVDRVPEELWTEVHTILQEAVTKTIPKKKQLKKPKWLSEDALQVAEERRHVKGKEDMLKAKKRGKNTQLNAKFQKKAKMDKKDFLNEQYKATEETNRMGKTRDLFKKIGDINREYFMQG